MNTPHYLLALFILPTITLAQPILPDGIWNEWTEPPIATDPMGDNTGAFDITEVHASVRGTRLFIAWDANAPVNLQAGDDIDGTIRIELTFSNNTTLTVDMRERVAYRNGYPSYSIAWWNLGYETIPTTASDRYETAIDLAMFISEPDETFTLDFSGSDSLDSGPITLQINQNPQIDTPIDPEPWPCTSFRIADLNTLHGGFTETDGDGDRIARLFDAVNPTIICMQEQDTPESQIEQRLNEIDPTNDGRPWSAYRYYGRVIATQETLIPIPYNSSDRFTSAVVDFGDEGAVFIACIHPKCCGYAGSSEDLQRIAQMQELVQHIENFQAGALGAPLDNYTDAGIVVIGDWNLVGSDTPLQIITDPDGPALVDWPLRNLNRSSIATWRSLSGYGFAPGRLDLVAYDPTRLSTRNGYILDTDDIQAQQLADLGLQATDSWASDHLLLVADFTLATEGDINADGQINHEDLNELTSCISGPIVPVSDPCHCTDLNNDNHNDLKDFALFQQLATN